jgi:hypothetical protein
VGGAHLPGEKAGNYVFLVAVGAGDKAFNPIRSLLPKDLTIGRAAVDYEGVR